ncbi:unnamed protein product [Clonostachys rosea f. rosea IK726]|uniref:Uncharacterized protein n=1 Tax=Clonostachys rosea f. rosea IK726 TaxID=1349383 RepID=A0ACA9UDR7_BIOOC|nr:unnamed protein product [Clonostachys rosea f. rosea IK726]
MSGWIITRRRTTRRKLFRKMLDPLRGLLNNACKADLPCASATVVSATSELFHHEPVSRNGENNDTTIPKSTKGSLNLQDAPDSGRAFWLASCTKLITTIACMQLVEQGKLTLDDGDEIEGLCPELRDIKVLNSDGSTSEKNKKITLRMLLTHTAGFGYSFLNKKLEKYNYNEFSGLAQDFHQPLVNQPGERFEYGFFQRPPGSILLANKGYQIGIDWAGIAVEALGDYMQKHIFTPAGIKNLSLFPSKDMIDRLAGIWQRDANGRLSPRRYPLERALAPDQGSDAFHSGGAGVWGTTHRRSDSPSRNGRHDVENQLPNDPNFARVELPASFIRFARQASHRGWGLGFMISGGLTGRSRQTVHWSGLSNCFWWCDREKGVAGIVASQVLPFADLKAVHLWADVETATYNDLAED